MSATKLAGEYAVVILATHPARQRLTRAEPGHARAMARSITGVGQDQWRLANRESRILKCSLAAADWGDQFARLENQLEDYQESELVHSSAISRCRTARRSHMPPSSLRR